MKNLTKLLKANGSDFACYTVSLVAIELADKREDDAHIKWDTERRSLVGFNPAFQTVQTQGTYEAATKAGISALNKAIEKLRANGYTILCAPKEIDTDNHDWRCISRIRTPNNKRVALIAYITNAVTAFDPWIY